MPPRIKSLALWLPPYLLFGAGIGLVVDSLQNDIRSTTDAVFAALRFPVIGLGVLGGVSLARRTGVRDKPSSPRAERAVAWGLVALTVASLAWLVIDFDAPGWRRLGLALVALGGLGGTAIYARAGFLGRRFRFGGAAKPDSSHLQP